jgi:hypothetical protein
MSIFLKSLTLSSFIFFISILAFANQPKVTKADVASWRKNLIIGSDYDYHVNILNFPSGKITKAVWIDLLSLLQDSNVRVRSATAYIVGAKKNYPCISIPALIRRFQDTDYDVAVNAVFSLNAYGKKSIPSLLKVVINQPKPWAIDKAPMRSESVDSVYIRKYFDSRYERVTKFLKLEPTMGETERISIPAVWSLFALRNMGNTVLLFLKPRLKIDSNYLFHILESVDINLKNCVRYYRTLKNSHIDSNYNYKLIYSKLALVNPQLARTILTEMNPGLITPFDDYITDEIINSQAAMDTDKVNIDTAINPFRSSSSLTLYKKLSNSAISKKLSKADADSVFSQLNVTGNESEFQKSDVNKKMLLILLANIGDFGDGIEKKLTQFENARDTDIRYLAIKAKISSHLKWTNGYVQFHAINDNKDPAAFKSYYDQIVGDMINDTLYHFRKFHPERKVKIGEFHVNYLDSALNIIGDDNRVFSTKDQNGTDIILKYLNDKDFRVRSFAIKTLSQLINLSSESNQLVAKALKDSSFEIRKTASEMLIQTGTSSDDGKYVTTFLLNSMFKDKIAEEASHLRFYNNVEPYTYDDEVGGTAEFPAFPDKVPQPSAIGLILWNHPNSNAKLGDLYRALRTDLIANKYSEMATFGFQDGFVLQTALERMKSDNTIDYQNRKRRLAVTPKTLADCFILLFVGDEGYFRGLSFIVCSKSNLQPFSKAAVTTDSDYDKLFEKGEGNYINTTISTDPLTGKLIHMLIYEFGKTSDNVIRLNYQNSSRSFGDHFLATKLKSFTIY